MQVNKLHMYNFMIRYELEEGVCMQQRRTLKLFVNMDI